MAMRGLVLLVVLLAAWSASALGVSDDNPLAIAVCGSTDVAAQMQPPTGWFAGYQLIGQCASLCKKAAGVCKSVVKGVASCQDTSLKMSQTAELKDCQRLFTGDSLKTCKQDVVANITALRSSKKLDGKLNQLNCDSWGSQCQGTCSEP